MTDDVSHGHQVCGAQFSTDEVIARDRTGAVLNSSIRFTCKINILDIRLPFCCHVDTIQNIIILKGKLNHILAVIALTANNSLSF